MWQFNGIPYDEPAFESDSIIEVKQYLSSRVYKNAINGEILGEESEKVLHYSEDGSENKEIPLNVIFSDDEFFTTKEWNDILFY